MQGLVLSSKSDSRAAEVERLRLLEGEMLRRTALIVATVLTAVVGAAHGAVFVNPIVALPGFPLSCSQLVDSGQRFPAVAGSATGRAIVAALAPNCSVAAALRSTGTAFGPPQAIGGQLSAGTEALDVPKALVNARGDAVVAWSTQNGCALAFAPAGSDTFGPTEPPTVLDGAACAIAIDGPGKVVATRDGGLVDRNSGGGYGPPANPFAAGARVIAVAGNERGDAVAVAESDAGSSLRRLDVSIRPAGGAWGASTTLAASTAYRPFATARDVSLAIDATGGSLIVWPADVSSGPVPSIGPTGTLMYATGTLTGIGSPSAVPAPGSAVLESRRGYVLATNARGDATIVFAAVTGALSGAFVLSDRPAGASAFGPAQTIGTVQTSKLAGAFTKFAAGAVPFGGGVGGRRHARDRARHRRRRAALRPGSGATARRCAWPGRLAVGPGHGRADPQPNRGRRLGGSGRQRPHRLAGVWTEAHCQRDRRNAHRAGSRGGHERTAAGHVQGRQDRREEAL